MKKEETFEVLETIQCFYPQFEITQKKINAWSNILKDDNYKIVVSRLEKYASGNKFPPSIADIREFKNPYKNDYLDKLKGWEDNASGKPTS